MNFKNSNGRDRSVSDLIVERHESENLSFEEFTFYSTFLKAKVGTILEKYHQKAK